MKFCNPLFEKILLFLFSLCHGLSFCEICTNSMSGFREKCR